MFGNRETRKDYSEEYRKMDACFHLVKTQLLRYQSPTTGLYPVSTEPPVDTAESQGEGGGVGERARAPSERAPSERAPSERAPSDRAPSWQTTSGQTLSGQTPGGQISSGQTVHGNVCREAHVRDSVYCAMTCWSLHLAYRRRSDDGGKSYLLAQSAVKTMRGVLQCWMRQSSKLALFNMKQSLGSTLHSVFDLHTGEELGSLQNYPHLQMDCVSLFIISLLQMIQSGLKIIYDHREVDFVQNLIFYVERNYRIADFGMWERGSKQNDGTPELNSSSVGFAKSVLEVSNGANLFGNDGSAWSVLFTDADAHMRNRVIFEGMLPRESRSKAVDASLIPTISWPSFSLHDPKIKQICLNHIKKNLLGDYGLKRYPQDGYGTQLEDKNRQHNLSTESGLFQGIESEWPFLLYFLAINYVFDNNKEDASRYYSQAEDLMQKSSHGDPIVARYYYVSEKLHRTSGLPSTKVYSMCREATGRHVFLWGQAVYLVARMLIEGVLSPHELDPLSRSASVERPRWSPRYTSFVTYIPDQVVQVVIIAESVQLQQLLSTYGISSQTPSQVHPIHIWSPNELRRAYAQLGVNKSMNVPGRPPRPIGCLGTAKIFRVNGDTILCYPLLFEINEFYLSQDIGYMVNEVQYNLDTISRMWKLSGRPTYTLLLREELVSSPNAKELISLLSEMKAGITPLGTKVKLVRVQNMLATASIEHLDFLKASNLDTRCLFFHRLTEPMNPTTSLIPVNISLNVKRVHNHVSKMQDLSKCSDNELLRSSDLDTDVLVQCQALKELRRRHGASYHVSRGSDDTDKDTETVDACLAKIRRIAGGAQNWSVVRLCSGICHQLVDSLAPSIMQIIVAGKQMSLGVFGQEEVAFDRPLSPSKIDQVLYRVCGSVDERHAALQQEMILSLAKLCETAHPLFSGIHKIRVGWIVQAMEYDLSERGCHCIFSMSPSEVFNQLVRVLSLDVNRTVLSERRLDGYLGRVPVLFYERVWQILERAPSGVAVKTKVLRGQAALADLSKEDVAFRNVVEDMLAPLDDPLYRQIIVETLMIVGTVLERNPEVSFESEVRVDSILDSALVHYAGATSRTDLGSGDLWQSFCAVAPGGSLGTCSFIAKAIFDELLSGNMDVHKGDCSVM